MSKSEKQQERVFVRVRSLCASYEQAYFGAGTKLTVLEDGKNITLPTVKIIQPSANECRDQKSQKGKRRKTLVCVASGFYPDHVSVFWELNNQSITDGVATDPAAKRDADTGNYTITSRLRVLAKHWFEPQNKFKCIVRFFDGKNSTDHSDTVSSNEKDKGMTRENYLKITQNAKLSYGVLIVKSCLYGVFVCFLVFKLQRSPRKQSK